MGLIIFNKKQQVGPERFGLSLVAGAVVILLLGTLHAKVHGMGYIWPSFITADAKLIFIALAVAIILAAIFLLNQSRFAFLVQDESDKADGEKFVPAMMTTPVFTAERLVMLTAVGNSVLLLVGLFSLVWQPITAGFEVVPTFGKIALSVIAIMLPLNYAVRLQIESYLEKAPLPARRYVWGKFTKVLYWVLVAYWAALFGAYVTLLLNSKAYCHLFMC